MHTGRHRGCDLSLSSHSPTANQSTQNHNTVEQVLFHCPEYDTCRQEYPDLLLGNMSVKNISDFDNQESIAKLLWKIRMIRIKLGAEC